MSGMWHEAEDYAAYMGEGRTDEPKVCAHGITADDVCEDCAEEEYQRELAEAEQNYYEESFVILPKRR